jgi:hypothetical protein
MTVYVLQYYRTLPQGNKEPWLLPQDRWIVISVCDYTTLSKKALPVGTLSVKMDHSFL